LISDIALFATAIGVFGAMFALRQSYRERLRQFEAMYVERYWKILDQLSLDALRVSDPPQISSDDEKAIRSYILLCEDELQMRQNGYISNSTYRVWAEGMIDQLDQPMFKDVWTQVEQETEKRLTFPYEHLHQLLNVADPRVGDPLSMSSWGKRLRGLGGPAGV
jgi:hypothetical protein